MHIKRFEAPTLIEAIRRVKRELGEDALVLSTRQLRRDGGVFGWLGRPVVEVVAARDREPRQEAEGRVGPNPSWQGLSLTKSLIDPLEAEMRAVRRSLASGGAPVTREELRRELAGLREALGAIARRLDPPPSEAEAALAASLQHNGFAAGHARALAHAVRQPPSRAGRRGRRRRRKEAAAERTLVETLAEGLDPRLRPARDDEAAGITLFVGAPGVGKTTSLAKIAAREGRPAAEVAVVSTDGFRAGAEEQLRQFTDRLGVPFELAVSPEDLGRLAERFEGRRVFVDTAGRARGDRGAVPELLRCRELLGRRVRVQLVVSATTQEEALRAQLDRFAVLRPDSLVVTQLDESERLAPLANVLLTSDTPPLAWLGTGQRVPEDLAVPEPTELATRILEGLA